MKQRKRPDRSNDTKEWSPYQRAVFDYVERGNGNRIVEAVAGSGKSTTIAEGFRRIGDKRVIVVAFGKRFADEMTHRLQPGQESRTMNSVGWRAIKAAKPRAQYSDKRKLWELAAGSLLLNRIAASNAAALVDKAKLFGIGLILEDEPKSWMDLASRFDCPRDEQSLELAHALLKESIADAHRPEGRYDYNDQIYHCLLDEVPLPNYDLVAADEAQDLSKLQQALLARLIGEGRMLAMGDRNQAIYAFRGADPRSFDHIREQFACESLPLRVSYRCSRAVVERASQIVPEIEPWEDAAEGEVDEKVLPRWEQMVPGEDVILCRNNAPLFAVAFRLIGAGYPVRILGRRDLLGDLKRLADRFKAERCETLRGRLTAYRDEEMEWLIARGLDEQADALADRCNALIAVIDAPPKCVSVAEFKKRLDGLFADQRSVLELATVHQAKGLEWERVWVLRPDLLNPEWLKKRAERELEAHGRVSTSTRIAQEQEQNLEYVAYTRARMGLYLTEWDEKLPIQRRVLGNSGRPERPFVDFGNCGICDEPAGLITPGGKQFCGPCGREWNWGQRSSSARSIWVLGGAHRDRKSPPSRF